MHRIESGVPLRGAELSDAHNPWEARLSGAVDLNKGCYIGQEVIARLEAYDKVKQSLVGLLLPDGASENDRLLHDGKNVGYVCSAAQHPEQRRIGLGYVRNAHAHPKTELEIDGRQDMCQIVDLPMH